MCDWGGIRCASTAVARRRRRREVGRSVRVRRGVDAGGSEVRAMRCAGGKLRASTEGCTNSMRVVRLRCGRVQRPERVCSFV